MAQYAQEKSRPEIILLVEDEDPFRHLVRAILQSQGYEVLEAPNGNHALRIARQHSGDIHLLISDMVIPEISAPELARNLQATHPEMKVLLISKYPQGSVTLDRGWRFLRKPCAPDNLLDHVRELLSEPPAPRAGAMVS